MNTRKLFIVIVTILVIVAAWKTTREKAPQVDLVTNRLYPDLIDRLNDVQRFSISSTGKTTELKRVDDGWVVANRDDFPAEFAPIKSALINLAETVVIEQKTSKPENYARIGVAGLDQEDSSSVVLRLEDGGGAELVSLIVGDERSGTNLGDPNHYVRKSDNATALLVGGDIEVSSDPQEWMDTEVVDITAQDVRKVSINRNATTSIIVTKEKSSDNFFTLQNIPAGFTAASRAVVSSFGALLLDVNFEDVARAASVAGLVPRSIVELQTFDGIVATLEQFDVDAKVLIRFHFEFNPDLVVAEKEPETTTEGGEKEDDASASAPDAAEIVAGLNAKVANWVYELPDYKIRMIDKNFGDLIKPVEKPAEESAEADGD